MNYEFPIINNINDVLPHITGRPEFIVAEREGYTVINYVVSMPDTFDMIDQNDLGGAIRRECRGIIFDKEGKLISRSYHKFFNISEREETQIKNLDFKADHILMEKMDGSMIRPLWINSLLGGMRLATKMGVTDIAMDAEQWLVLQSDANAKQKWISDQVNSNKTPIFEWVSPNNRIVIHYEHADLVLTAIRDNKTGVYLDINSANAPFTIVPQYGSLTMPIEQYIEQARQMTGREGDIIRWANGHMGKLKNDTYVRIHKTKDRIRSNRNIVDLMLNNELDDLMPHLDAGDTKRVRDFELSFWKAIVEKEKSLSTMINNIIELSQGNRKTIALQFIPSMNDKADSAFIFGVLDNKSVRDMIMVKLNKSMNADARFDEFWQWLKVGN
jgi:RNA ligase